MAKKVLNGLDLQSQRIIGLADPSTSTDAASNSRTSSSADMVGKKGRQGHERMAGRLPWAGCYNPRRS